MEGSLQDAIANLKYDGPVRDSIIAQLTMRWNHYHGIINDSDPDWQDDQILIAAQRGDWPFILGELERKPARDREWNHMNFYAFIEACEHPDCPPTIVSAFCMSKLWTSARPCVFHQGIGAKNPANVLAERGNLRGLEELHKHGRLWECGGVSAIADAIRNNRPEILKFLLGLDYSYNAGHGNVWRGKLYQYVSTPVMFWEIAELGHFDLFKVIDAYHPGYCASKWAMFEANEGFEAMAWNKEHLDWDYEKVKKYI